ncbi:pullulanase [Mycoplasmoides fastidiosum]|uniref:Pullulanase n=1 Tax=Mycoplasmoides fastidiosum TaxID=92758 RepID=A0ABU0LYR5_9BACT|nr:type I pullulanase [Mycoplasmoides fastidiosum]MDQ0513852.1 pullulanase [Mycoplasmoides fastidiosum]UUD37733.1 type I pullulanase [Mycoplasmoides fastidiosum]
MAIAYWNDWKIIDLSFQSEFEYNLQTPFFIFDSNNQKFQLRTLSVNKQPISSPSKRTEWKFRFEILEPLTIGHQYYLSDDKNNQFELHYGHMVRSAEFDQTFFYDQNDLGCTYNPSFSIFKVWTPIATQVDLVLIDPITSREIICSMQKNPAGVWATQVDGDYEAYKYLYQAKINFQTIRTTDPYAHSSDANNKHSFVIDWNKIEAATPQHQQIQLEKPTNAIIYEISIRDFTDHQHFQYRNKFLGLTETNLTDENNHPVGLDYLKWLGISHVQLLPIYDFATIDEAQSVTETDYNWGYDPLQYNVPEGSYTTDPHDPYARIMELKKAIATLHQNHIGVVMDVVYNHVYDPDNFAFNQLVPYYFFQYDHNNQLLADSQCGNDVNSSRKMVDKFILDSIQFWTEKYQVDGFRFDLMGILHFQTFKKISTWAQHHYPQLLLYGEGWIMKRKFWGKFADFSYASELKEFGFFNDVSRDFLRGNANHWTNGQDILEPMREILTGSIGVNQGAKFFDLPMNSMNYVEIHDGYTLWDHLQIHLQDWSSAKKEKIHLFATACVLLAQGVPVLHGGQELFRSKKLVENSYNAPLAINQFPWDQLKQHFANAEKIRKLIAIRKEYPVFCLNDREKIRQQIQVEWDKNKNILYTLNDATAKLLVGFNYHAYPSELSVNIQNYELVFDSNNSSTNYKNLNNSNFILEPYSFCILKTKN